MASQAKRARIDGPGRSDPSFDAVVTLMMQHAKKKSHSLFSSPVSVQWPGGSFQSTTRVLRSAQHKLARRGAVDDLKRVALLLLSDGYLTAFADYCATIALEDVGMANPRDALYVVTKLKRVNELIKSLPLSFERASELLLVHMNLCERLANTKKNRFVAENATIQLLKVDAENMYDSKVDKKVYLQRLVDAVADCRAGRSPSVRSNGTDGSVPDAVRALVLAQLAHSKNELPLWNVFPQTATIQAFRWLAFVHNAKGEPTSTPRPGSSANLAIHTALWISCGFVPAVTRDWPADTATLDVGVHTRLLTDLSTWIVPEFALDKHTGGAGGYPRFYFEGLYVPPEQRFMPEMDDRLRGEALELRMRLESVAKNSSKSAHVRSKIVGKSSQLVVAAPLKLKVFQQLTASHKKFVFLEEDGLHVLKGPYVLPQDRNRFNLNIQMTRRIVELDAARAIRPTVFQVETCTRPAVDGMFLRWQNAGGFTDPASVPTTSVANRIHGAVDVMDRGNRVSDLKGPKLTSAILVDTLNHLYIRAILGIGDSGPHNVLVTSTGRAVGVDLEERRSSFDETDAITFMFKSVGKAIRPLYEQHLHEITELSQSDAERLLESQEYVRWALLTSLLHK